MFKFGLPVSNRCSCNTAVEDVFHFLFACPKYVVERDKLQTTVIQCAPFTMHTLLEGHDECSEEENRLLLFLLTLMKQNVFQHDNISCNIRYTIMH